MLELMPAFEIKCQRFTDSIILDIDKDLLNLVETETKISTPKCLIKGSNGMFWWVTLLIDPGDDDQHPSFHLQFHVSKTPVKASFSVASKCGFKQQFEHVFKANAKTPVFSLPNANEHVMKDRSNALRLKFDGVFQTVKPIISECTIEQNVMSVLQRVHNSFHDYDAEIVVGSERIEVHRDFLSLISPIFKNLFFDSSLQTMRNTVVVPNATPSVVRAAIQFCYGKNMNEMAIAELDQVYQFAKEYEMQAVIDEIDFRR